MIPVGRASNPFVTRLNLMDPDAVDTRNVILGGPHVICRCYICNHCQFVALYYDEQLTAQK